MLESFSPTGLKLARDCPFCWSKKYVEGMRLDAHSLSPAGTGTEIHQLIAYILQQWHNGFKNVKLNGVSLQVSYLLDNWIKHFNEWFIKSDDYLIEKDIHTLAGGYPVHCIVDYVSYDKYNGVAWIFDWKSTRIVMKKEALDYDIQMLIQAYVILKHYLNKGIDVVKIGYWLLRYNRYVQREEDFTIKDLPRLESAIVKEIEYVYESEKKGFPATPSSSCSYCNYRTICPKKDIIDICIPTIPKNDSEATRLFKTKQWHESNLNKINKLIRDYIDVTGQNINYDKSKSYGMKSKIKTEVDMDMVSEFVDSEDLKDKLGKYIKINISKSSDIWHDKEALKILYDSGSIKKVEDTTVGTIYNNDSILKPRSSFEDNVKIKELYIDKTYIKEEI